MSKSTPARRKKFAQKFNICVVGDLWEAKMARDGIEDQTPQPRRVKTVQMHHYDYQNDNPDGWELGWR